MTPALNSVVTIQEAARLFFVHENTVRYHIDRGNLKWRKVGSELRGVYLIDLASLIDLYGIPSDNLKSLVSS